MTLGLAYRKIRRHPIKWLAFLVIAITWTAPVRAQDPSGAPAAQSAKPVTEPKPEVSTHDTNTTFKLRVNLVQVRVVVRDSRGKLIEGLKPEDFQLFDQGKLQAISTFGVETAKTRQEKAGSSGKNAASGERGSEWGDGVTARAICCAGVR